MEENNYTIKFTPVAHNDLKEMYSYISQELFVENVAEDLLSRIETNILRLNFFPYSGSYPADAVLRHKGYRLIIIDNYIVFYIVDEQEKQVIIMRVLHGKQKYADFL